MASKTFLKPQINQRSKNEKEEEDFGKGKKCAVKDELCGRNFLPFPERDYFAFLILSPLNRKNFARVFKTLKNRLKVQKNRRTFEKKEWKKVFISVHLFESVT